MNNLNLISDSIESRKNLQRLNFDFAGMVASYVFLHIAGLELQSMVVRDLSFYIIGILGILSSLLSFYFSFDFMIRYWKSDLILSWFDDMERFVNLFSRKKSG